MFNIFRQRHLNFLEDRVETLEELDSLPDKYFCYPLNTGEVNCSVSYSYSGHYDIFQNLKCVGSVEIDTKATQVDPHNLKLVNFYSSAIPDYFYSYHPAFFKEIAKLINRDLAGQYALNNSDVPLNLSKQVTSDNTRLVKLSSLSYAVYVNDDYLGFVQVPRNTKAFTSIVSKLRIVTDYTTISYWDNVPLFNIIVLKIEQAQPYED